MMFLEPELVVKRVSIVAGAVIITLAASATVWYNTNLKNIFIQNINETSGLRQETTKIGAETDSLKAALSTTTREFKTGLAAGMEETKKLDSELKTQTSNIKLTQQEFDKFRVDTRSELQKIRENNAAAVANLLDQIKVRDASLEKYKTEHKIELQNLINQVSEREREIVELRTKLDSEVEWRKKNFWGRN